MGCFLAGDCATQGPCLMRGRATQGRCLVGDRGTQARNKLAIPSLRLRAVLNRLSECASFIKWGVSTGAPRTDAPLTHFVSPRGGKRRLVTHILVTHSYVAHPVPAILRTATPSLTYNNHNVRPPTCPGHKPVLTTPQLPQSAGCVPTSCGSSS